MRTVDEHVMRAPAAICYQIAADVENWPTLLPHYRWVRFRSPGQSGEARVEMAAWREFFPAHQRPSSARWPTWWVSDMRLDANEPAIYFRHVAGITRGMDVKWEFFPIPDGTRVRIVHEWPGPRWPLVGRLAADTIIGPAFISAIARRTLAGLAAEAERRAAVRAEHD